MNAPEISIIIPVYNNAKYIDRLFSSLFAQTFTALEFIFVNDGSTDDTDAKIQQYATKDERVRHITQTNQGAAVARNRGLSEARGRYIGFVDADDLLDLQALEIAHYFIKKHQAQMFVSQWRSIPDNLEAPALQSYDIQNIKESVYENPLLHTRLNHHLWSKLYTKELLQDLRFIEGIFHDDLPFCYEIYARRPKTVIIKEPLYLYTSNPNSITATKKTVQSIKNIDIGLARIHQCYSQKGLEQEYRAVKQQLLPLLLNSVRKRCLASSSTLEQVAMLQALSQLLHHQRKIKVIGWNESVCWSWSPLYLYRTIRIYHNLLKIMRKYPKNF